MISNCPVCATEIPPSQYEHPHGVLIQCRVCGNYRLMEQAHQRLIEHGMVLGNVIRPNRRLSGALRQRVERGEEPVLSDPEAMEREYRPASDLLEMIDRIVKHIASKGPAGNKFIPLIGHRDYAIAGAEDPEAFDFALGQAQEQGYIQRQAQNEAAYRLTPTGWTYLRSLPAAPEQIKRIFLSHAAADMQLAGFVRDEILRSRSGISVFVASRPGDIRADQDWLPVVQHELQTVDAYLVLLTPNSAARPWVWFETGAAWMSNKKWVIARAAGLAADEVPLPLSIRQVYSIDEVEGARAVFRALDIELSDPAKFVNSMRNLAAGAV